MTEFILKYWIEVLFTGLTTLAVIGYRHFRKNYITKNEIQDKRLEALEAGFSEIREILPIIKNGEKSILRYLIISLCNEYREKGYCPAYAIETLEFLYKDYVALGGNGLATTLKDEMHKLPREKSR